MADTQSNNMVNKDNEKLNRNARLSYRRKILLKMLGCENTDELLFKILTERGMITNGVCDEKNFLDKIRFDKNRIYVIPI